MVGREGRWIWIQETWVRAQELRGPGRPACPHLQEGAQHTSSAGVLRGCSLGEPWGGLGMWPLGTTPLRVDLAHCHLGHVPFDPPCPRFLICKAELIVMPTLQFVL